MPLARILTLHPEDATNLIQQLQRIGFEVEVADPNEEHGDPADLEIEFAVCDQQQVIARAGAIANQLQAEVVVFPGAIPPLPRPVTQQPVSDFSTREEPRPEEPVETPAFHETDPERHGSDRELPELAGIWFTSLGERMQQSGQETISGLKRVRTGVSSALSRLGSRASEYRERMRLRGAERRVAREQRRTELVREAAAREQERLKQEEIAAAARQEEFQRLQTEREERRAEMERLRVEAEEQAAAQHQARLEAEEQRKQRATQLPGKQTRGWAMRQPSQLRGVFTGAIAAAILFAVGMLLANFSPTTPLPASVSNGSVEQQVPFGPTTLHGAPASAGVTVGGMSAPKLHAGNNVVRPATPAPAKPQPSQAKAPAPKRKTQWRHFRSSNRNGDDGTADDVVVRHFGPQQKAQPHAQQAGLKRYSDMQ